MEGWRISTAELGISDCLGAGYGALVDLLLPRAVAGAGVEGGTDRQAERGDRDCAGGTFAGRSADGAEGTGRIVDRGWLGCAGILVTGLDWVWQQAGESARGQFFGAEGGSLDGLDEGDAEAAFFELEDAVHGAAGGGGDLIFEQGGMIAGLKHHAGCCRGWSGRRGGWRCRGADLR